MMTVGALGRLASRHDARTLDFRRYATRGLPPAPPLIDWSRDVGLVDEYRNREIGICALASAAHTITVWNASNGRAIVPTQADVEHAYSEVGGYVADDPSTWGNGAEMLSVLNYWRREGIGGHKIRAFLKLDPHNLGQLKIAAWLFGPLYVGANLRMRDQSHAWSLSGYESARDDGSWGGHAMACPRLDRGGGVLFTWGERRMFTWAWWRERVDEVYCVLSDEWADSDGTPHGFDFATLERDLRAIGAT